MVADWNVTYTTSLYFHWFLQGKKRHCLFACSCDLACDFLPKVVRVYMRFLIRVYMRPPDPPRTFPSSFAKIIDHCCTVLHMFGQHSEWWWLEVNARCQLSCNCFSFASTPCPFCFSSLSLIFTALSTPKKLSPVLNQSGNHSYILVWSLSRSKVQHVRLITNDTVYEKGWKGEERHGGPIRKQPGA